MKPQKTEFKVVKRVREYCLATGQHGYKFIALPGQKTLERILWAVVVAVGLVASIVMLCAAWGRKDMNPTLIALNTAHYPVWNIDFPAITLCGLNRIKKSRAIIVANGWRLPSGVTREQVFHDLIFLSQLIDMNESNATKFGRLQSVLDMNNITATVALREVMLPCEELLVKCKFKGKRINCKKVFRLLETPYGFCCSFNYHANKVTTKELIETPSGATDRHLPYRMSACGHQLGLTVLVHNHIADYYDASMASYGVKVLVHNPYDYPGDNTDEIMLSTGRMALVAVYPEVFQTTADVRESSLQGRHCLLWEERVLRSLRRYSYSNCYSECRQNFSIHLCGCSPFYYPNLDGQRICNLKDIPCLRRHKNDLFIMGPDFDDSKQHTPCQCLSECSGLIYLIETSEGDLERKEPMALGSVTLFEGVDLKHDHSLLHLYYIDLMGTRYVRNMIFSRYHMLSSLGGILSLFLGFSFIAGIELVYFFTIRLLCSMPGSRSVPGETNSLIATSVISGTSQYFSPQVSNTTSSLAIREKIRTRGPPVQYSRRHEYHESVWDI